MLAIPSKATVIEVGPRDGLQSEPEVVSTADKIALIERLAEAGYRHIEMTSFVNPRWVPQRAIAAARSPAHEGQDRDDQSRSRTAP